MNDLERRALRFMDVHWTSLTIDNATALFIELLRTERRLAFDEAATRLQEMIDADRIVISPDEIRALGENDGPT